MSRHTRARGHFLSCPTWADKKAECRCAIIEASWKEGK